MKVLVTGGTGFVGQEIVRQLHQAGHTIRILVRHPQSPSALEIASTFGCEIQPGSVLDAKSLPASMAGVDAVIHLVGIIAEFGEQTFENVHTRGTQNVIAAMRAAGIKRLVHMSALGTKPNARARYHQTKWVAEQAIGESGIDWTIFRPSIIYGPRDQFVNLFVRIAERSPVVPVMGNGRTLFQPVALEIVAGCFVKALSEPRAIRETFDLCGPERFTLPEILQAIFKITKRKKMIIRIPLELARPVAALLEFFYPRFRKQPPPLSRDQLLMLQQNNVGDAKWPLEIFNMQQESFEEGVAKYLAPAK